MKVFQSDVMNGTQLKFLCRWQQQLQEKLPGKAVRGKTAQKYWNVLFHIDYTRRHKGEEVRLPHLVANSSGLLEDNSVFAH